MENGHCRHLEHSSLKPGMFAYLGEEKALMEEVAVLIRRFQTRMKQERREFQIQGVLIQGECLKAPRSDAGVLAKCWGSPVWLWEKWDMETAGISGRTEKSALPEYR